MPCTRKTTTTTTITTSIITLNAIAVHILINKKRYELEYHVQTGEHLKHLAGIPLGDVLFLQRPGEDEVIPNHAKITLKDGEHFHSQPPADYGLGVALLEEAGIAPSRATVHAEPGGWVFVVISRLRAAGRLCAEPSQSAGQAAARISRCRAGYVLGSSRSSRPKRHCSEEHLA